MRFTSFFREWRELSRFRSLSPEARSIVFYAEDGSSWNYFGPIVGELTGAFDKRICYVTSSTDDPILRKPADGIRGFYIGSGSARTAFFSTLEADVMVMTMPDLGTYHIKRSKVPVHYVYVFHSLISTHMSYRPGAFDQFDAILCTGPHHKEEIRAMETLLHLEPKVLVEAGYGRLDAILRSEGVAAGQATSGKRGKQKVLLAPSWGPSSVLETHGSEVVEVLLGTGHDITVRPHVMARRNRGKLLNQLQVRFGSRPNFTLDLSLASQGVMHEYDLLVAFGLERPVLFVDVPRKVFSPDYEQLGCIPMEVRVRSDIGEVVSPDALADIPGRIEKLFADPAARRSRIQEARSRWVYNVGASGRVGAEYIARSSEEVRSGAGIAQRAIGADG
jgi:YidC/Oxa1 family membrane protein insertase